MKKFLWTIICWCASIPMINAQYFITEKNANGAFAIVTIHQIASIYVDDNDDWLVQKAASLLQSDFEMVTGKKSSIISSLPTRAKDVIIIGTVNESSLIKKLASEKKINIDDIKGKWETFKLQTLADPLPGIKNALVIMGSDKRGAAYGVFELSRQLGVSPWYWWADVPVKKKPEVFIRKGVYEFGPPSVKYRGIFINDEAPCFSGWTKEKFGGVNHLVYEKIFELLLRLKANYLWPAMWANAFNDDDPLDPVLANKYGIVMGTSHHEPMLRAQQEWKRYGKGLWSYDSNEAALNEFWKQGIEHMDNHESIVTIGMRGDGDKPMTQGTSINLLERIVTNQRKIIEEVTRKPASQVPQLWALYKEVQDYYDEGMRVPDDVTLLLCDDNWGNIRRLPKLTDKPRRGGYGIYYHFDYVGGPRNYKWINTNNIARVWEQMHLAYEYGVNKIWIVNVGDLKPMEFPISFFLDYAWNVTKWNADNLREYYAQWAAQQFGPAHAKDIAFILARYAQYIARRKPELLDANIYTPAEDIEVVKQWEQLEAEAKKINDALPPECKDAYFELVLYPVEASANLHELYSSVAWNNLFAESNSSFANKYADQAVQFYQNDSLLSAEYNHVAKGKWDHMMDQTHIGYTYWQQPAQQKMPTVMYVTDSSAAKQTIQVSVDESKAARFPFAAKRPNSFFEMDGYVSIEAAHYTNKMNGSKIIWKVIPGIGRDGDGITTFPVMASEQTIAKNNPHLSYDIYTYDTGSLKLQAYFSPTLNFHDDPEGLKYGISIDREQPQIISINKDDSNQKIWEQWVSNNVIIKTTDHAITKPGKHTVHFWMISPAVVLQKIVINFGEIKPGYLGPPETLYKN